MKALNKQMISSPHLRTTLQMLPVTQETFFFFFKILTKHGHGISFSCLRHPSDFFLIFFYCSATRINDFCVVQLFYSFKSMTYRAEMRQSLNAPFLMSLASSGCIAVGLSKYARSRSGLGFHGRFEPRVEKA